MCFTKDSVCNLVKILNCDLKKLIVLLLLLLETMSHGQGHGRGSCVIFIFIFIFVIFVIAKVCFAQCSTSRLALGSSGCCCCAQNSIYANIYRF